MEHFHVDVVVHGHTPIASDEDGGDPYAVPKARDQFVLVDSLSDMTTEKIVERIIRNRLQFEERNIKKERKEVAAYEAYTKAKHNT